MSGHLSIKALTASFSRVNDYFEQMLFWNDVHQIPGSGGKAIFGAEVWSSQTSEMQFCFMFLDHPMQTRSLVGKVMQHCRWIARLVHSLCAELAASLSIACHFQRSLDTHFGFWVFPSLWSCKSVCQVVWPYKPSAGFLIWGRNHNWVFLGLIQKGEKLVFFIVEGSWSDAVSGLICQVP